MAFQIGTTTVIDNSRNLTNITNQNSFVSQGISDAYDKNTMYDPYVGAYAYLLRANKVTNGLSVAGSELRFAGVTTGVANFPADNNAYNSDITAGPAGSIVSGTWRAMGHSNSTYTYTGAGDIRTYDLQWTIALYVRTA